MSEPSAKDRDFTASLGAPWQQVGQVAAYREECERAERERVLDLIERWGAYQLDSESWVSLEELTDILHGTPCREERVLAERAERERVLAELTPRIKELESFLKIEQDNRTRLMEKFCKAMGTWEGSWEDAAIARLKAFL